MNTVTTRRSDKETTVSKAVKFTVIPEKRLMSKRSNMTKSKRPGKGKSRNEIKCSYKVRDKANTSSIGISICEFFDVHLPSYTY